LAASALYASQAAGGVVVATQPAIVMAEVAVGGREPRIDADRLFQAATGRIALAQILHRQAEVVERIREVRIEPARLLESLRRLPDPPGGDVAEAEAVPVRRHRSWSLHDAHPVAGRLVEIPAVLGGCRQEREELKVVRSILKQRSSDAFGLQGLTLLIEPHGAQQLIVDRNHDIAQMDSSGLAGP
jgi:hypothetical protein